MSLTHDTIRLRRRFAAPRAEVFEAWAEKERLEAWSYPGDETWTSRIEENAFHEGGAKRVRFGPTGDAPYLEDARYLSISPGRHIINSERILGGDGRLISVSVITIEFHDAGPDCELTVTDQITLLDGRDTPEQRRAGWGEVMDRLGGFLAG